MADDRRIVIEILNGDVSGNSSSSKNSSSDNTNGIFADALSKMFHPINTLESNTVGKNVLVNQAYQQAKQQIIRTADFYHNRYFSLKEDYISETTYNNVKTTISKATGLFGAAAAGGITGAKFGPAGAVAGTMIGMAGYGINEYINNMQTKQGYYQELNTIGYETAYAQMRAGLIDNGRGTEN